MSTSAEGSVNGKCEARKRSSTSSTSKNDLQNSSRCPFQHRHRDVGVDGQPLDLMEHRRVGLVVIGAVHATGRR